MGRIFDLDSPLMQFLNRMADLMILNLVVLICCIPVVTIGAATTGMHYVLLKMARKEEGYTIQPFFKAFKENFKQSTVLWLIWLVIFAVLGLDFYTLYLYPEVLPRVLRFVLIGIAVLAWLVWQMVFPLQSHFENTIKGTMRNALLISVGQFPKVFLMAVVNLLPVFIVIFFQQAIPAVFMFGLTLPGFACAHLYSPIFKLYEPEEEETPVSDNFYIPETDEEAKAMGIPTSIREGLEEAPGQETPAQEPAAEAAADETAADVSGADSSASE